MILEPLLTIMLAATVLLVIIWVVGILIRYSTPTRDKPPKYPYRD